MACHVKSSRVPLKSGTRATSGTRAIGSPPLYYTVLLLIPRRRFKNLNIEKQCLYFAHCIVCTRTGQCARINFGSVPARLPLNKLCLWTGFNRFVLLFYFDSNNWPIYNNNNDLISGRLLQIYYFIILLVDLGLVISMYRSNNSLSRLIILLFCRLKTTKQQNTDRKTIHAELYHVLKFLCNIKENNFYWPVVIISKLFSKVPPF